MTIASFDKEIKIISITCTAILLVHKKHNFFATVYTGARYVKLLQPAEPIFSTPTLLMRASRAMPAESVSALIKRIQLDRNSLNGLEENLAYNNSLNSIVLVKILRFLNVFQNIQRNKNIQKTKIFTDVISLLFNNIFFLICTVMITIILAQKMLFKPA